MHKCSQNTNTVGCLTITLILLGILAVPSSALMLSQECGDLKLTYSHTNGVSLSAHGIEVIRKSTFNVVLPDWSEVVFSLYKYPHLLGEATVEDFQGGKRITIPYQAVDEDTREKIVEGAETITLLPGNTIRFQIELTLLADIETKVEWMTGAVRSAPLVGCSYEGQTGDGRCQGRFPILPSGETVFADDIRRLQIDSRLGPITIQSDPETRLRLFDYRTNRWSDPQHPFFWMGRTSRPLKKGQTIHYDVTMRFPEQLQSIAGGIPLVEAKVETARINDARIPTLGQSSAMIPKPKQIKYTGKRMRLKKKIDIFIGANPSEELESAAAFLVDDLKNLYGLSPAIRRENPSGKPPSGSILLGSGELQKTVASFCAKGGLHAPDHEEGYALRVTDRVAAISAKTAKGAFYGVTTLLQLIALDEKQNLFFKGTEVADYPSLSFRGIHCFTSHEGAEEISRAFRRLMARFKINTVVWECEFLQWDAAPEIAHEQRGMEKSEARKVLASARENFIEIIPLVQSLGHSRWMFHNGQNLDLAEDPETPYAYNPTNPDTYKFIFSIFEEALEFFQPQIFHIGHDEVTLTGRFPYRSRHTGKSATDLVMQDIDKLNRWFKERGVQVMLWGDMFLADGEAPSSTYAPNKEEARKRRQRLPKDVWVADWHYRDVEPEQFISLPLFRDLGHPVVGCTWYRPGNIANQSIAARNFGAEGMLHTTWAGYNFKIDDNQPQWYQYLTYITAAHYFWSDDTMHPNDLAFDPSEVFLKTWFQEKPLLENRKGFTVDLSPLANRSLVDTEKGEGWLGFGPGTDLSALPPSQQRFGDVCFNIPRTETGLQAVMLAGQLNPKGSFPKAVQIKLKKARTAEAVHFLMTSAFPTEESKVCGNIAITYTDGQTERFDLRYKRNLFASTDDWIGRDARIAWKGRNQSGQTARLWDLAWTNPHPEKEIAAIRIGSAGTEAAPILFAVTGVSSAVH